MQESWKKDGKSGWLPMVPLPHLNFFHFRPFPRGPFGTGSIQAICRDFPVALRGSAQICWLVVCNFSMSFLAQIPRWKAWLPFGFYLICFNFGDVNEKCPKEWHFGSFWHPLASFYHLLGSFRHTWEHFESFLSIFSVCWIPFPPWLHITGQWLS